MSITIKRMRLNLLEMERIKALVQSEATSMLGFPCSARLTSAVSSAAAEFYNAMSYVQLIYMIDLEQEAYNYYKDEKVDTIELVIYIDAREYVRYRSAGSWESIEAQVRCVLNGYYLGDPTDFNELCSSLLGYTFDGEVYKITPRMASENYTYELQIYEMDDEETIPFTSTYYSLDDYRGGVDVEYVIQSAIKSKLVGSQDIAGAVPSTIEKLKLELAAALNLDPTNTFIDILFYIDEADVSKEYAISTKHYTSILIDFDEYILRTESYLVTPECLIYDCINDSEISWNRSVELLVDKIKKESDEYRLCARVDDTTIVEDIESPEV